MMLHTFKIYSNFQVTRINTNLFSSFFLCNTIMTLFIYHKLIFHINRFGMFFLIINVYHINNMKRAYSSHYGNIIYDL